MEIAFALIVLFIFVTMAFLAIAFFFPEWVGIQGKVAKQFEEDQKSSATKSDPASDDAHRGR